MVNIHPCHGGLDKKPPSKNPAGLCVIGVPPVPPFDVVPAADVIAAPPFAVPPAFDPAVLVLSVEPPTASAPLAPPRAFADVPPPWLELFIPDEDESAPEMPAPPAARSGAAPPSLPHAARIGENANATGAHAITRKKRLASSTIPLHGESRGKASTHPTTVLSVLSSDAAALGGSLDRAFPCWPPFHAMRVQEQGDVAVGRVERVVQQHAYNVRARDVQTVGAHFCRTTFHALNRPLGGSNPPRDLNLRPSQRTAFRT
jgi:hypothetical protein